MRFLCNYALAIASLLSVRPAAALVRTVFRDGVRDVADPCDLRYALDLSGKVISSNLGRRGPDLEAPEGIFIENVIPVASTTVDLEVTVASGEYHPLNSSENGISNSYGIINVRANSFVNLRFRFVDHFTRESFYNPNPFYFTLYDIDKGMEQTGIESVYFGKDIHYKVADDTELALDAHGDYMRFVATMYGNSEDNPTNPLASTPTQLKRTISLVIPAGSAEFATTFQVEGGRQARNFMFAGPSPLVCPIHALCSSFTCPSGELRQDAAYTVCGDTTCTLEDTPTCCCSPDLFGHFGASDLLESSIGERADGKISFGSIMSGSSVEMKVVAMGDFSRINPSLSGTYGSYGILNLIAGSSVTFKFSFRDHFTGVLSPLPPFRMAIMDFDLAGHRLSVSAPSPASEEVIDPFRCLERVHVTNFTNYRLYQDGSHVSIQDRANGEEDVLSKEIGGSSNNPSYYLDLSEDAKGLSVNFEFPSLAEFYVTFSVGAGCKHGRSIQFTKPVISGLC